MKRILKKTLPQVKGDWIYLRYSYYEIRDISIRGKIDL